MLLTLDIGNTRVKYCLFNEAINIENGFFLKNESLFEIEKIFKKYKYIKNVIYASVSNLPTETLKFLENNSKVTYVTNKSKFPFINLYESKNSLGIDRMVLASGAVLSYPEQAVLVIDMGTCITFDFVDAERNYHGGAIAPGMQMRYQMMHEKTAKLPLLSPQFSESVFGKTTEQSMHIGVTTAICSEIDSYVDRIQKVYGNFTIILTGGDAVFFAKKLKSAIFANSNFLLESLYHLYLYQISNDQSF